MEKKPRRRERNEILKEYPPVGKYRIRLIQNSGKPESDPVLDIREYVTAETFEGFTRRGIRLGDRAQIDLLRDILKEVLERCGIAKPAPGTLPLQ